MSPVTARERRPGGRRRRRARELLGGERTARRARWRRWRARRWTGERARKMAWASGASGQVHTTAEARAGERAHRTAGESGRARRRIRRALPVPSRARNHWFLPNGEMVVSSRLDSRVDVVSLGRNGFYSLRR
ncbi:hypothetical protein BDA96_02G265900 [Sorghum bicolor]|uniref:Uncharacterized protein n=1 Tax=Sorghum bicolor TaxID=4558 RepID=A0A921RPQ8_SORBI|nr:hypothetical protein BDA96_02G265900 [Sorghum bicolor]